MNYPNEYIGLHLADQYMKDRLHHEKSRRLLMSMRDQGPGRIYCLICRTLATIGHMLVAFGRRLERLELTLSESKPDSGLLY